MKFEMKIEMDEAMKRLLALSDERVLQAAVNAVNTAVVVGEGMVAEATPVQTARLRNSITHTPATPEHPVGAIHTNVAYAPAVEFGTGIYGEAPGAPRRPITIRAKQERLITFTRNGRTYQRRVVALAFKNQAGEWRMRKEVTIQGQQPAAMFRRNLPAIRRLFNERLQAEYARLFEP